MKKIIGGAFLTALLITACTPKSTAVATANTPSVTVSTAEQIAQGKMIFENSCKKCHKLYSPDDFTSVEWVGIMNAMAPKAKLSEQQHQWVYDYIVSAKTK